MTADLIIQSCADAFGVTADSIKGHTRSKAVDGARQAAYWILRIVACESYPRIGKAIGNRAHSCVIFGVRHAQSRLTTDFDFSRRVSDALKTIDAPSVEAEPCASFRTFSANGRPGDYLPEYRRPTDLCVSPGCGQRRMRHGVADAKAA